MKWLIASDIHGSAYYCEKLMKVYDEEKADKILLLGDLLYHGPRNDLPENYNPKAVISMLNTVADKILCVRGNCDAEVDQMVLDFSILSDYAVLCFETKLMIASHGHIFNKEKPVKSVKGHVLICGHTHVPECSIQNDFIYINPGSVSIPKEGSPHSYMIFEDNKFCWKDLCTGEEYKSFLWNEK